MSQQLLIDSRDRDNTSDPTHNFTVDLKQTGEVYQGYTSISLLSCNMPQAWYNVESGVNDTVTIDDGTEYSATLTPGNYTFDVLGTELQTKLNALGSSITFTVTADSLTGTYQIDGDSSFELKLAASDSAWNVLGFKREDRSTATSHTSDYVVSLQERYVGIRIRELGSRLVHRPDLSGFATFWMPCVQNAFDISVHTPSPSQLLRYHVQNVSKLSIEVVDRTGALLDLHGAQWGMVLGFFK